MRVLQYAMGWISALVVYPLAERIEKRYILNKRNELRRHYKLDFHVRKHIMTQRLADIAEFCGECVPYYRDLFRAHGFNPAKLRKDASYIQDLPFLSKDIVREQGRRLLSRDLEGVRCHNMKTGGSTGLSAHFLYDQDAADYSAAVTLFARECIGKKKHHSELHFACRFPDMTSSIKWTREDWKCLAMNRSNIFFDRLDAKGLDEMWKTLVDREPYLIHGHPSTIHALAAHIQRDRGWGKAFEIFESSGELLEPHQRKLIADILHCKVIDRYGLAEFGVMAYQLSGENTRLQLLDSEGWPESLALENGDGHELVLTGFRNKLMPLLRYRTGDLGQVVEDRNGFFLTNVVGRIHDLVPINGVPHPTHHIMDMLDHRVGGIQEFQIDLRGEKPILRIVAEPQASEDRIREKIHGFWGSAFELKFEQHDGFVRVGRHQKFRHLVHP